MAFHSVAEAKNQLPSLIDRAIAGEEIIISRHGRPVAVLRPVDRAPLPVDVETVAWLQAHRVGRARTISAGELVSAMREDD